jgi:NitT/TauT family transport system substrate-binding protein
MPIIQTRRRFISSVALAGAAGHLHIPSVAAAEGALETTSVRLPKIPSICVAPQDIAEELLRAEGFTDTATYLPAIARWRASLEATLISLRIFPRC